VPNPHQVPGLLKHTNYALSIKQPWAALVVAGIKTIEIRKWATSIRGRIFVHAAIVPDKRPEGWAKVPEELRPLAETVGGVIGEVDLLSCIGYRTPAKFTLDAKKHLNDPSWFEAPQMYGFQFGSPALVEFIPWKGNVRFFTVDVPKGE